MLRMPTASLMKSLFVGGRALTGLARERGGCWRCRGLGSGMLAYCTAGNSTVASKRLWLLPAGSSVALTMSGLKWASPSFCFMGRMGSRRSLETSAVDQSVTSAVDEFGATNQSSSEVKTDELLAVAVKVADAAGDIIRQLFRTKMEVADMEHESPLTVAVSTAEYAMSLIISQSFPTHAMYAEESGLQRHENNSEYLWVMDSVYGAESFLSGKPSFGTLISLVHKGIPIIGIIDQPILRERWIGIVGKGTTLNGEPVTTRSGTKDMKYAYMFGSSPHLFVGPKQEAYNRTREMVKVAQYGADCYAYGLLASGFVDLVIESGLKPCDFLPLIPVIEGAGGYITDWQGEKLKFSPNSVKFSSGGQVEIVAAGSVAVHKSALAALTAPEVLSTTGALAAPPASNAWGEMVGSASLPPSPPPDAWGGRSSPASPPPGPDAWGGPACPASPPQTRDAWAGRAGPTSPPPPTARDLWEGRTGPASSQPPPARDAWEGRAGPTLQPRPPARDAWGGRPGPTSSPQPPARNSWEGRRGPASMPPSPVRDEWGSQAGPASLPLPPARDAWEGWTSPASRSPPPAQDAWGGRVGPASPPSPPPRDAWGGLAGPASPPARDAWGGRAGPASPSSPPASDARGGRIAPVSRPSPPAPDAWGGRAGRATPPPPPTGDDWGSRAGPASPPASPGPDAWGGQEGPASPSAPTSDSWGPPPLSPAPDAWEGQPDPTSRPSQSPPRDQHRPPTSPGGPMHPGPWRRDE